MFGGTTPVVLNLIIINGLVWLLQLVLLQTDLQYMQYFVLVKTDLFGLREALYGQVLPPNGMLLNTGQGVINIQFQPYQLVTHFFAHSPRSFMHILFNMMALFFLGPQVERVIGAQRFLRVYLFSGVVGGIFVTLLDPAVGPVLGASGAVSGIMLLFAIIYPNAQLILFPIPIPIRAKYLVGGIIVISTFLIFYNHFNETSDSVSHFGHLSGMAATVLYIFIVRAMNQARG